MEQRDLRSLAAASLEKKRRLDSDSRLRAIDLFAHAWTKGGDFLNSLELADDFQSDLVAEAIRGSWSEVPEERKGAIREWLQRGKGERASRRLLLSGVAMAQTDPCGSLALLSRLIPHDRPLNKETRDLAISVLLSDDAIDFISFAAATIADQKALPFYVTLLRLALDRTAGVEMMKRFKLVQGALLLLGEQPNGSPIWSDLIPRIDTEMRRWPTSLQQSLREWIASKNDRLVKELFPEATAAISVPTTAEQIPVANAPKDTLASQEPVNEIHTFLQRQLDSAETDLRRLRHLFDVVGRLGEEVSSGKQREKSLHAQIKELLKEQGDMREVVEATRLRLHDAEEQLARHRSVANEEKTRLTGQIGANADARVQEFQNRLSAVLSRFAIDLPPAEMVMTVELGTVILLQFHQFIDQLEQRGVSIRPRRRS